MSFSEVICFSLRQDLLQTWNAPGESRLAGQRDPEVCLTPSSQLGNHSCTPPHLTFCCCLTGNLGLRLRSSWSQVWHFSHRAISSAFQTLGLYSNFETWRNPGLGVLLYQWWPHQSCVSSFSLPVSQAVREADDTRIWRLYLLFGLFCSTHCVPSSTFTLWFIKHVQNFGHWSMIFTETQITSPQKRKWKVTLVLLS